LPPADGTGQDEAETATEAEAEAEAVTKTAGKDAGKDVTEAAAVGGGEENNG
jgi:hypothetical protein